MLNNRFLKYNLIFSCLVLSVLVSLFFLINPKIDNHEQQSVSLEEEQVSFSLLLENSIKQQKQIDEQILDNYYKNNFTLNHPLIVLNPYSRSPLTALIAFQTDKPARVSITIDGLDLGDNLYFSYDFYANEHFLPIYGLFPGNENSVQVQIEFEDLTIETAEHLIQTDGLRYDLAQNIYNVYLGKGEYNLGFNFSYHSGYSPSIKSAFDKFGNYRWYLDNVQFIGINYVTNYRIPEGLIIEKDKHLIFIDYFGKIYKVYELPENIHHDIEIHKDSLYVLSHSNPPYTLEDYVLKIDLNTGVLIDTIDYRKVLLRTREYGLNFRIDDWMHSNSVVGIDEDVIVSSNWQSTVIRNDWNGNIKWMLTDPSLWPTKYNDYVLKPVGEVFEYPYNQHAVEVINHDVENGIVDIILFDNGSSRFAVDSELQRQVRANEIVEPKLYSRMVIYRINEKQMTVEQLWQYGKDRPELFAKFVGDADLLQNGNVLGTFRQYYDNGSQSVAYVEVDFQGNVVWEVWATSKNEQNQYFDYRLERLEMYQNQKQYYDLMVDVRRYHWSD